ncbi:MAG: glycosyltransferase [Bacteroidetes bacterium]|jgi:glycosyltransferase involved in cell wall biosynthesis|nr:glycosyltransferase [Bacteroidota bacterium]
MTELKKTLIILSPGFPKNEADSTCIPPQQVFVRNLKLKYPGLNIIVLAFEYPFYSSSYLWNDVSVISFGGANKGGLTRLNNWRRVGSELKRLNKIYRLIGLLSFWMGDCAFIADRFAKKHNLKHFCWILGQDARQDNKYFRWVKPDAENLIALSDFIAAEIKSNYSITPAHVIPVGVDPKLFGEPSRTRDIDILGVGSLIPLKLYSLLINMIGTLHIYFPNIRAIICGDGPEKHLLETLIKDYRLEKNIELTGELPHTAVLALMQRTKIFAHPSSYEGLGVVCLEALYAGAQVVSFVRPMDEPIKNWHFAKTPDDMVNVLKRLLEDSSCNKAKEAPYLINETCNKIMNLFGYNDSDIS